VGSTGGAAWGILAPRVARILIVDDDKMTRVALEALLRNEPSLAGFGIAVTSAADGHDGLAALAETSPDVAIVDLLMPRLDGFQTCKALRDHPKGAAIDLCVISGVYRDAAIEKRVESELGARFFAKPEGLRELVRHVGELLHRRRSAELQVPRPRSLSSIPLPPREGARRPGTSTPPPSSEPVRGGDLAYRPLAAVLLDLHDAAATGRLTLRRDRVAKTIDLAEGNPVGAAAATRDETLGHFLVGAGIITDEQHKQAVHRTAERGEKVGEALIALGTITPARLAEMLTAQVRHKLVSALRWPQGLWRFVPGPLGEARDGLRLRMVELVLGGLAETSSETTRRAAIERLGASPVELTERGRRLADEIRRHFGAKVPDVLAGGGTFAELEQLDLSRDALRAAIDALSACDALSIRVPALGPGAAAPAAAPRPRRRDTEESTGSFIGRLAGEDGSVPDGARALYEQLFEDVTGINARQGEAPVDLDEDPDSGVIEVGVTEQDEAVQARQALLKEYLRVQGVDPYAVLLVEPKASAATISAALVERQSRFAPDYYARFHLGPDQAKLDAVLSAYERARTILLDDGRRAALDRELAGGELTDGGPAADAELSFRAAEDLLARRNFPAAIARLQAAVAAAPDEADYHALLGWAHWLAGGGDARAADLARPHLNQALSADADHAAAHEYKGRIDAALGTDDLEALFHLERALSIDPARADALTAAEEVYLRRGEAWPLVRLLRKILHHLHGRGGVEVALWTRLAALLRDHLDDTPGARQALLQAQRLAPQDPAILAALARLDKTVDDADDPWAQGVARWRHDLGAAAPGIELMRWADDHGRVDAAFLAASALVALGHPSADGEAVYARYRPRFVVRAQRNLSGGLWGLVRHPDDTADLGALMELLAPAVHAMMPMSLDDLEVDDAVRLADEELPDSFRRLRAYLAGLLGTGEPTVYVRSDFGRMLHVGALAEPVLLVGDDALANPERAELAFRLARAMTFLWPGRAAGSSRPARVLKALTLALLAEAAPGAADSLAAPGRASTSAEWIGRAREALDGLPGDVRGQARALILRVVGRSSHLNLSRWARGLARTADRIGLLVCGDLPAARRYAADGGATDDDLVGFALSPAHLRLRGELGLSIDV
jgi:DNA-binding response OmpR family regulator/tetratricopeptide (TPR) repeat protein